MLKVFFTLSLILATSALALAQFALEQATVRINTEGHLGPIRAIDIDAKGETLVTAGDDKTARVWDARTGTQLRVLRPQIGAGNEGALNAVAISGDGKYVAAAGWSAGNDVMVFDRASGELIHRLSGLQNVTTRLAFAPSGNHLAIGQFGDHPVVFATSADGWKRVQLRTADDHGRGAVNGLSWSPTAANELVATRSGGAIARISVGETEIRVAQRMNMSAGASPHRVRHARDGRRIVVGGSTGGNVWILDATSLAVQSTLATASQASGATSVVAWTGADNGVIAAGGLRANDKAIFARGQIGGGSLTNGSTPLSSDTILDLVRSGDDEWIAASAAGEWVRFNSGGTVLLRSNSNALDMRPLAGVWRTRSDGTAFTLANRAAVFSVDEGWATLNPASASAFRAPVDQTGSARLSDFQDRSNPKWNGRAIAMDENERSLSGAIHPRGEGALLGTQWAVRRLDASGKAVWTVPTTTAVWQTAWSGDAQWAVIASGDGTVRWLRAADGEAQLTAFFHGDGKRWVAWTPSGYFSTSPGGEDLIGWHVNRGVDRVADYYPGSRLRATFYRPDVVARILATGDEKRALQLAGDERSATIPVVQVLLPPLIQIVSPSTGSFSAGHPVNVTLNIRTPKNAPLTALRVRQDGVFLELPGLRLLPSGRDRGAELEYALPVSLPTQRDAKLLSVFAENVSGASQPVVIALIASAPTSQQVFQTAPVAQPKSANETPKTPVASLSAAKDADLRPVLYVLAVGVADYKDKDLKLDFAAKDANDFAAALRRQEGQLYRQVNVRLVVDKDASRDGVLDGLEWMRRSMTSRDVGMVFLAGHGVNDADDVYYFLPQDAQVNALKRTGVIFTEIKNTLASLPGKAMFFVDTCHSGNVLGAQRKTRSATNRDITRVVNELASAENGVIVFAASTGKQLAQEATDWKNGAFTLALVEGLSGKADFSKTGRVTHKMLDLYVSERVKMLTEGAQSPVTIVPQGVPDFPLAVSVLARG